PAAEQPAQGQRHGDDLHRCYLLAGGAALLIL
ncbi:uncharacterized protein METZ01_LOCUS242063, partial [marine metagenome]